MWSQFCRSIQGVACGVGFLVATTAFVVVNDRSNNESNNSPDRRFELPCASINTAPLTEYQGQRCNALQAAIDKSKELIGLFKVETGAPGFVVGVSIDGKKVWEEGIGYSDLENKVLCSPDTVMRIASISKSITMTAVAKIWEEGKLDLDKPVQEYVPSFPEKIHDGEKVNITTRHLVSHLSGIRHYVKKGENSTGTKKPDENNNQTNTNSSQNEFKAEEYYIKEHFPTVTDSLNLFKDDPLAFKPGWICMGSRREHSIPGRALLVEGTSYLYTTHGWTLVSAVVEAVVKIPFSEYITKVLKEFGMHHTYLDVHEKLIYNRARFYVKNKKGRIENAPYVDNSYKWAGGGILSTVGDLLQFSNLMLYSFQYRPPLSSKDEKYGEASPRTELLPGFLKYETVEKMWMPIYLTEHKNAFYGMGWGIVPSKKVCGFCEEQRHIVGHSGGAIGGSSNLLIMPRTDEAGVNSCPPPRGITVAILTNLQDVDLYKIAAEIAKNFDEIPRVQS